MIFRVIFFCRMLHFTAFWKHKVPNNAVKWGEKCLILRKKPAKWRDFVVLEQVTGLEPVISAWKANVLPLHYTCLYALFHFIRRRKSPFINRRKWSAYEWSGRRGSNPPPQPWQGCALPNELLPQEYETLSFGAGEGT